ncbi:MAG: zinc ABC transporter substrate-binding protein [Actinobacteria bacterium]|nr:zinc ABC transporter substrate-binding protein [Actinomycetota bacterium]
MKRILIVIVYIMVSVFLIGTFINCTRKSDKDVNEEKIRVVVSIPPQAEFVERVGEDRVKVTVMVPPGASPHTYESTPGQLEEISKAKIYAKVGSGIEFELAWMDKIIKMNGEMLVVDCASRVKLFTVSYKYGEAAVYYEYDESDKAKSNLKGIDPHIWLSPANAKIMVENIYEGLVQIDPQSKEYYKKNLDGYLAELDKLDDEIVQTFSGKENKKIIVFHPTWAYFAKDYGIEQIPIEEEGKEPTAKGIEDLISQAKEYNIKVIFASPEFSTKSAETVAREIGGRVDPTISPLEKDYLENMRKAAEAFAGAME